MIWKFWVKDKKAGADNALNSLKEQLTRMGEVLDTINDRLTGNSGQVAEIAVQVGKVARIQYKTGQDMQAKLERLSAGMEAFQKWQAAHEADAARLALLERQVEYLAASLIRWLDDIDLARARLRGEGQESWRRLLEQWAGQILAALAETGIQEIKLLGESFNPQLAESIGVVERGQPPAPGRDGPYLPYEVVEIVRRGFVAGDGRILRKALVITVKED